MGSKPENPEIRNNLENFNPCIYIIQDSYRQDCVKFKDFSRIFLLFSRTENLRKILIYALKFF